MSLSDRQVSVVPISQVRSSPATAVRRGKFLEVGSK